MLIPNPSRLTATAYSCSQVDLEWQQSNGIVDGYKIERYAPDAQVSWVTIGLVNTTSYQDVNLKPATEHIYRVCAVCGESHSEYIEAYAKTPPPAPNVPTRLTAEQVIEVAKSFCQNIGHPVGDNGTAQFPVPDEDSNYIRHWQSRWQVAFETEAEQTVVEVVDSTGIVASYASTHYPTLNPTLSDPPDAPAGTAIAQVDAIQEAMAVLQFTSQDDELASVPEAAEIQFHDPPLYGDHNWVIQWQRQRQGIPYRQDGVLVMLQAETGALTDLSLHFPTPPPASTAISVDQTRAESVAQAKIAGAGLQGLTGGVNQTQIVQPNTFWQDGHARVASAGQASYVAWIIQFWRGDPADNFYHEVWVDAQTGEVIGGDACFGFNGVTPKHNSA